METATRDATDTIPRFKNSCAVEICCLGWLLLATLVAGCQALASENVQTPDDANATVYVLELTVLQRAADLDQAQADATLSAGGTRVAELSRVNAALGATLRAAFTPTAEIRAVVVSAEDMGSSLDQDMMDDMPDNEEDSSTMRIVGLATARAVNASNGCSTGEVRRFDTGNERIYVTARVEGLRPDTYFEVDWQSGERVLYRVSWRATYAAAAECIWFYATPVDFPFLPGNYRATLFVNGQAHSSTDFSIAT
ncbi:MAG: hypothetical protein OXG39_10440 [Chloroflexi bacterium]|nr:hypothetical protein [Chloroflexota bacterium]